MEASMDLTVSSCDPKRTLSTHSTPSIRLWSWLATWRAAAGAKGRGQVSLADQGAAKVSLSRAGVVAVGVMTRAAGLRA